MAKIVSRLTKIEQEMPEEVWKKIAAGTPDSALKSWASREAYFNAKYQDYLKAQPKPGTPVEKPAIQTTKGNVPNQGLPPGGKATRLTQTQPGAIQTTTRAPSNKSGLPPGGNKTSLTQTQPGAIQTTTRAPSKKSGPPPGGNKTTLRGRKPKPKINKGKRQTV